MTTSLMDSSRCAGIDHLAEGGAMLSWNQAFLAGTAVAGGKGWNLGRLARYGFAVPQGGVLSASIYEELLSRPEVAERVSALSAVEAGAVNDRRVTRDLAQLRQEILRSELPAQARRNLEAFLLDQGLATSRLAVRSSAVAEDGSATSFAGIHESYLNVVGGDAVCDAVLKCYASLWTPQAVAYRRRFGVSDRDSSCAVVLCEMVGDKTSGPIAAGVAFSCNPVTGERSLVTINLTRGLGDAVVRGTVDPQQFRVEWHDDQARIERTDTTGGGAILSDEQIHALSRHVMRVHWALGEGRDPQDVEWAFDGTAFWMLQSRPVTHLPRWTFPGARHRPAIWSNANVRDSFPNPVTALTWSFMDSAAQKIVYASLRVMGYPIPSGMEILRCFAGRPYFDLDGLQWAMYDAIGIPPAETNRTMGGFQPEIEVAADRPLRGFKGVKRTLRRLRFLWRLWRFHEHAPKRIAAAIERAKDGRNVDLSRLSDAELLEEFRRIQAEGREYQPVLQLAAAYFGGWMMLMQDLLEKVTGDRAQSLVTRLLAASGNVASAEQGYRLRELANLAAADPKAAASLESSDPFAWRSLEADSPFRRGMNDYLDEFGHRAVFEMEFASPRWFEDPTYLLEQIRFHRAHPGARDPRLHAAGVRTQAEQELRDVPWHVRPIVRWMLRRTRRGAALRENAKSGSAAGVVLVRHICHEVGRRLRDAGKFESRDDVFHLSIVEIEAYLEGSWDGQGAAELVKDRKARLAELAHASLPGVIIDEAMACDGRSDRRPQAGSGDKAVDGQTWSGVPAAPGAATGPACVIHSPHDAGRMKSGDVLVAPSTDPGWTPLFLRASAIVMETGGYLSHGAIVAREFGIPAVVNVEGAMQCIHDSELLLVDGDAGRVTRLDALS